jgi:hypothetical protein
MADFAGRAPFLNNNEYFHATKGRIRSLSGPLSDRKICYPLAPIFFVWPTHSSQQLASTDQHDMA